MDDTYRRRNILIGVGAVVAVLAIGGGAYALGANIAGGDRPNAHGSVPPSESTAPDAGRGRPDADAASPAAPGDGDGEAVRDAASLRAAAEKAIARTGAQGAMSIERRQNGHEVEVLLIDGTEEDVFVATDSTITQSADGRDASRKPLLDLARLDAILKAALGAAANGADGTVTSVATSDDLGVAYTVGVALGSGRDAEVELDSELRVAAIDLDD